MNLVKHLYYNRTVHNIVFGYNNLSKFDTSWLGMFAVGTFFSLFASGQVQKFNGIRIDAPAKASKRNATSQVGDKIIELFSQLKLHAFYHYGR